MQLSNWRLARWVARHWWHLLAIGVALGLLPLLLLSCYNQPYSDDFSFTPDVETYGFWIAQKHLFANWSGRYFTNALLLVGNPLNYRWLEGVQLTAIVGQLVRIAVLYAAVRLITGDQIRRRDAGLLATSLALVYSSLAPSAFSALYYFTDLAVYQVPAWLLLLVPLAIDRLQRAPRRGARWVWSLLAAAGTIAIAGSTELTIVLLSVVMLLGAGVSLWRRQWQSARVWVGLGALLVVASTVALLAPGNTARMTLDSSLRPTASIQEVLVRLFSLLRQLLTSPAFLVVPAFVLLLRPIAAQVASARPPGLRIPLLLSAAVLVLGLIVGTLPYALTWARVPLVPRAANILLWWWLLGWLMAGWASLPVDPAAVAPVPTAARGLLGVALAVVVLMASGHAYLDLRHEAPAFATQWQNRFAALKQAGRTPHSELTLQPQPVLINRQIVLPPLGLAESPDYGINTRLATWFGLDSVRVGAIP